MDVRVDEIGVFLVRIEQPVAVVDVDVHVREALHAVLAAQGVDDDADVVEYAEARRRAAPRMMEAADRLKGA